MTAVMCGLIKIFFLLDDNGYPTEVAGVPPDYFSKTGQLWGNPLYDWAYHKKAWLHMVDFEVSSYVKASRHCSYRPL